MRTDLPDAFRATPMGQRADEILRSCVHCGFCNATCPTYLLQGDELDGPRGRIYLIKDMLETGSADAVTRTHLDRCLTCRACETTCPSGVAYGDLIDIGREVLESQVSRTVLDRGVRAWLRRTVPFATRFRRWARLGHAFRWLLPARMRDALPPVARSSAGGSTPRVLKPAGRVVLLEGCVQQVATPEVNVLLVELLARHRIEVIRLPGEACCGSLALHLGHRDEARRSIERNLAALRPLIEGVDAVLSTASGCGVTVKDWARIVGLDTSHAATAAAVAERACDVAEYLDRLGVTWQRDPDVERVAWHAPCTLQHGQRVTGVVERLLTQAGYQLVPVEDPHLCCGSAGTYSILEPELSERLRDQKLAALGAHDPEIIATANIGCQLHLGAVAGVPVLHWLQLLR